MLVLSFLLCVNDFIFAKSIKSFGNNFVNSANKNIDVKKVKKEIDKENSNFVPNKSIKQERLNDKFLPQNDIKIKRIATIPVKIQYPNNLLKYRYTCQGMTTDSNFIYFAVVVLDSLDREVNTRLVKVDIKTLKKVAEKDFGEIGHCNSLTYNPKTDKIYAAPLFEKWKCVFEISTDFKEIQKIELKDNNDKIIEKKYWSFTYLINTDKYILKTSHNDLIFFDCNFKFIKNVKLKKSLLLPGCNLSQALSTDEEYLYGICGSYKDKNRNYVIIYDMEGNFIRSIPLTYDTDQKIISELEQIAFIGKKCYGVSKFSSNYGIYEINLRKTYPNQSE